jgi:alkaline phosphatase D
LIRDDPSRTLMGGRQENWFYRSLSKSQERGAAWRIIGNQIIFSRITENWGNGEILPSDNWSVSHPSLVVNLQTLTLHKGYVANRNRTLEHLYDNEIGNNIFLAGDSHQNWVSFLTASRLFKS